MTASRVVVEVTSFNMPADTAEYQSMADNGAVGVVFKVSQGLTWRWPAADDHLEAARDAGLLVGVLHYLDPRAGDPRPEVAALVERLSPGVYELGVILEIEPPLGDDLFGFSQALMVALDGLEASGHRAGLRCDGATLATVTGAPWAARWWCGETSEMTAAVPFATWVGDCPVDGDERWPGGYRLTSVRGLNIGGAVVVPAAPETPVTAIPGAPTSPLAAANGPDDGPDQTDPPLVGLPPAHGENVPDDGDTPEAEGGRDDEAPDWRAAAAAALS
jgi:hypothetical protein